MLIADKNRLCEKVVRNLMNELKKMSGDEDFKNCDDPNEIIERLAYLCGYTKAINEVIRLIKR